jgi:hypothetical protein
MRALVTVAAGLAVAVALVGCAARDVRTPHPSHTAATTYTAADLVALLTKVDSEMDTKGTLLTDADLKARIASTGGQTMLQRVGGTVTPEECQQWIARGMPASPELVPASDDGVAAELTFGSVSVGVATSNGKRLPAGTADAFAKGFDGLIEHCTSFTVTAGGTVVDATLQHLDLWTDADRTMGVQEVVDITSPDRTVVNVMIAVKDNVIIFMSGIDYDTGNDPYQNMANIIVHAMKSIPRPGTAT